MARIEEQNFVNAWLTEPHEEQEDANSEREDRCVRNQNHHLTQDSFA